MVMEGSFNFGMSSFWVVKQLRGGIRDRAKGGHKAANIVQVPWAGVQTQRPRDPRQYIRLIRGSQMHTHGIFQTLMELLHQSI